MKDNKINEWFQDKKTQKLVVHVFLAGALFGGITMIILFVI